MTESAAHDPSLVLAFDTGSPITSVALWRDGAVMAQELAERAGASDSLVALIDTVLRRAGAEARDLDAICALRGPGSFTGLRIGLATALGLHQALGVRVAAMPTLRVLAEAADAGVSRVAAVVDALRGEWFVQIFARRGAWVEQGAPHLLSSDAVNALAVDAVVGFGARRIIAGHDEGAARPIEPPPLAPVAARLASRWTSWDPALLTEPLYLRPAPATAAPRR